MHFSACKILLLLFSLLTIWRGIHIIQQEPLLAKYMQGCVFRLMEMTAICTYLYMHYMQLRLFIFGHCRCTGVQCRTNEQVQYKHMYNILYINENTTVCFFPFSDVESYDRILTLVSSLSCHFVCMCLFFNFDSRCAALEN